MISLLEVRKALAKGTTVAPPCGRVVRQKGLQGELFEEKCLKTPQDHLLWYEEIEENGLSLCPSSKRLRKSRSSQTRDLRKNYTESSVVDLRRLEQSEFAFTLFSTALELTIENVPPHLRSG